MDIVCVGMNMHVHVLIRLTIACKFEFHAIYDNDVLSLAVAAL